MYSIGRGNMAKAKGKVMKFMGSRIVFSLAALVFVQCSGPNHEIEAQLGDPKEEMEENNSGYTVRFRGNPKLGSSLNQLLEAYREGGMAEAQAFAVSHMMVLQGDRVQVTIVTNEEAIGDVRVEVEAVGGEYQLHYRNLLQALVPIGELELLAQRPDIRIIREPRRAVLQ